jgi:hypothetical protein
LQENEAIDAKENLINYELEPFPEGKVGFFTLYPNISGFIYTIIAELMKITGLKFLLSFFGFTFPRLSCL